MVFTAQWGVFDSVTFAGGFSVASSTLKSTSGWNSHKWYC